MSKSLQHIELPDGFEAPEGRVSEIDTEENKIYDMWMIETAHGFDDAVLQLTAFLASHFDGERRAAFSEVGGFRSWAASCTAADQEVSVQLSDNGRTRSGYLRSVRIIAEA